jgi:hypothetical protein
VVSGFIGEATGNAGDKPALILDVIELGKILPKLLLNAGDNDEAREQAAFAAWVAAAGANVSKVTAPVRLEQKTLIVATSDETWRTQLRAIAGQLVFKLNAILGLPTVARLDLIVNPGAVRAAHQSPPKVTFKAPDDQALPLRDSAANIPLPQLRDLFLRAAGKCLDRRAR